MTVISLYRHCSAVMFEKSIPVCLQVFGFPYLTKKECKKNLQPWHLLMKFCLICSLLDRRGYVVPDAIQSNVSGAEANKECESNSVNVRHEYYGSTTVTNQKVRLMLTVGESGFPLLHVSLSLPVDAMRTCSACCNLCMPGIFWYCIWFAEAYVICAQVSAHSHRPDS